jgi:hypothetical protein
MASLIEQLVQSHGPQIAEQISSRLGIPADKAAGVLPAVAPLILGGLQRQAKEPGGEERVNEMVEQQADAGLLDNLSGFFSQQPDAPAGDAGLGGLLGGAGTQATQLLGEKLGISSDKASQIIPMLAPIVMSFLLKQKMQGAGSGAAGGSLLTSLLDRDGDGQILDDVAGMLGGGSMLGSLLGGGSAPAQDEGGSAAGDLLGKALGGLFGGKK